MPLITGENYYLYSSLKILSLLHKVQDAKLIRVLILDDTVENKVGKNIEGKL